MNDFEVVVIPVMSADALTCFPRDESENDRSNRSQDRLDRRERKKREREGDSGYQGGVGGVEPWRFSHSRRTLLKP